MGMNKSPKVLYVSHIMNYGGAEVVLMNILRNSTRWEGRVILPEGAFAQALRKEGIPVTIARYLVPLERKYRLLWPLKFIFNFVMASIEVLKAIKVYKPDIIHSNHMASMPYCIVPGMVSGKKIIWHMHDIKSPKSLDGKAILIMSLFADRIIAVSDAVKEGLLRCGVKSHLIVKCWNGIDESCIRSSENESFNYQRVSGKINIAQVGVVFQGKGQHVFVDAVNYLESSDETRNKANYCIIGKEASDHDGYMGELRKVVREKGLEEKIVFYGKVSDMIKVYKNTDVIVLPSVVEEAFPTVILEAMYMGCLVVASSVGGVPEIIDDRVTGLLFEKGNSRQLAGVIKDIEEKRIDREEIVRCAKIKVNEKYGLNVQMETICSVYRSI